ncbi:Retrovirus-related Pol polyprotein from transposon TNT 1-94 [Podarcis lilfordi]|uniref:Retrovirus-related Pol polyprotein from transposon TNT 1-94 n=1 Tax=Podarcis lilfordi TaxID=74358 RepID=A0AA35L9N4_9SAUR|nr:Retrovirus-related Pol polyprotein from transposon TNT 1-94 [Podarcis lilfordi]
MASAAFSGYGYRPMPKLNEHNFVIWKKRLAVILEAEGNLDAIEMPMPTGTSEEDLARIKLWKSQNSKARVTILDGLEDEHLSLIDSRDHAAQILNDLERMYGGSVKSELELSYGNIISLLQLSLLQSAKVVRSNQKDEADLRTLAQKTWTRHTGPPKERACEGTAEKHQSARHIVRSDLCEPMNVPSLGKNRYILNFLYDFSKNCIVYFLKGKSEMQEMLKNYLAMAENEFQRALAMLMPDNVGEYCSHDLQSLLEEEGIEHVATVPYTPQQSSIAERKFRSVMEVHVQGCMFKTCGETQEELRSLSKIDCQQREPGVHFLNFAAGKFLACHTSVYFEVFVATAFPGNIDTSLTPERKQSNNGQISYVLAFVDDLIIATVNDRDRAQVVKNLSKDVEVKELGKIQFYLGIQVEREEGSSFLLSQKQKIYELIQSMQVQEPQP